MPAKIIPFPKKTKQDLSQVEQLMRKWLAKMDASQELTEYVVKEMLNFINNYANKTFEPVFNLPLPASLSSNEVDRLLSSLDEGVSQTADQVCEMINKIIIERFFLEIEIYEIKNIKHRNI